ncbi:hypothetical protein T439DRAFT_361131 [Meredithblackwellia eburnea MCA 4105]
MRHGSLFNLFDSYHPVSLSINPSKKTLPAFLQCRKNKNGKMFWSHGSPLHSRRFDQHIREVVDSHGTAAPPTSGLRQDEFHSMLLPGKDTRHHKLAEYEVLSQMNDGNDWTAILLLLATINTNRPEHQKAANAASLGRAEFKKLLDGLGSEPAETAKGIVGGLNEMRRVWPAALEIHRENFITSAGLAKLKKTHKLESLSASLSVMVSLVDSDENGDLTKIALANIALHLLDELQSVVKFAKNQGLEKVQGWKFDWYGAQWFQEGIMAWAKDINRESRA